MKTATPATAYKPGHFTEPVYARSKENPCGWPPRFEPTPLFVDLRSGIHASQRTASQREQAHVNGTGWGAGTVSGLRGSGFDRPGWMGKS